MNTAKSCIQTVFPQAKIETKTVDQYPITVTITASNGQTVWTGSQKHLYRKYASKRNETMQTIINALKKMK
jgi:hypothetical protein